MAVHELPLNARVLHGYFSRELEDVLEILASVGVDLHVTQIVNGAMGVHAELRDDAFR
jgi:acetamidase/formamidase